MSTLPYASPSFEPLPFKDKRAALVGVTVICFLIACGTGCFTLAMPLSLLVPMAAPAGGGQALMARQLVPAAALYLLVTVAFIWLGIGALRARRWVRPLLLPMAWIWIVGGVLGLAMWLIGGPGLQRAMQASAPTGPGGVPTPMPAAAQTIAVTAMVVMSLILLGLPAILIALLSSADVRRTAEYFSPAAWTDRRPLPVLGLALTLMLTSMSVLLGAVYPVVSLFGVLLLSGVAAVAALVVAAVVLAILAIEVVRLRRWAWWAILGIVVLEATNLGVTALRVDMTEMQRLAGQPKEQLELMQRIGMPTRSAVISNVVVAAVVTVGYLFYVRRHFFGPGRDRLDSGLMAGGAPSTVD